MCRAIPRPIAPPNSEGLLRKPLFQIASNVPCLVHDVVAIAENWRQMLASQRANSLNIGESHWPHLEINPSSAYLMRQENGLGRRVRPDRRRSTPWVAPALPLQSTFQSVSLAVLCV